MKISIFIPSMEGGGAERVVLNIANALSQHENSSVSLILSQAKGIYLDKISSNVRIIDLQSKRTMNSLYGLVKHLKQHNPDVLISAINHANIIAVIAKLFVKKDIKLILTQHTMLSHSVRSTNKLLTVTLFNLVKLTYPLASKIITVSKSIENDVINNVNVREDQIQTIYNPIMEDRILEQSLEKVHHDWFKSGSPPVILSVGRLNEVKDYPTLFKAFKILREKMDVRLLVLGEGALRENLTNLSHDLELKNDIQILGFVENPYKYMSRARVLAMSSLYEGFGNVLVEALACGTDIVSTNCPGGVSEILDNGRYGVLVPVGDVESLAKALFEVLNKNQIISKSDKLKRALDFSIEKIVGDYTELIYK